MSLLLACALTVLLETPFLWCFGMRGREKVLLVICTNIATNLTLNLCLLYLIPWSVLSLAIGEAIVVLAEFAAYLALTRCSLRLLLLTLAANALSFCVGLLLLPPLARFFGFQ